MITRDFILRQIQQLVAVLSRVLLLRGTGQNEAIIAEIRLGLSNTELSTALLDDIEKEALIGLCSTSNGFSFEKALALADLLREKGFSERELELDNWYYSLLHALWLYERINSLPNAIKPLDIEHRIESLRIAIGKSSVGSASQTGKSPSADGTVA